MILASPMFRKLLLRSLLVILVAVLALNFLLTRYVTDHETGNAEKQLQAQARILADEVARLPADALASWTKEAHQRSHARITLIEPGGRVLADSEADAGRMENHAGRPEVREALQGRPGSSVRHSDTLDHDLLYLALPVTLQGRAGHVLRLAVPLKQLGEAIVQVRWRIVQASLIAALLSLGVAYLTSRSLSRRIRQVQLFADGLVEARFSETLPPEPEDELGALARSLNRMSSQLRDMLERLKLESSRREAILTGIVEGVLAVDHELCVTFCNQAFARAVGARYPVPERLPVLELVRDPAFLILLTSTVVKVEAQKQHLQLSAAEGHSFEVQAAPLELRSGRGAIVILHDVTDLERLERVRRDFVANVSHELRTPLAAIQGYAETLLEGGLEDQRAQPPVCRNHPGPRSTPYQHCIRPPGPVGTGIRGTGPRSAEGFLAGRGGGRYRRRRERGRRQESEDPSYLHRGRVCGGEQDAAGAGAGEPPDQRREVQPSRGRSSGGGGQSGRRSCEDLGSRQRHWNPIRGPAPRLRAFLPGG